MPKRVAPRLDGGVAQSKPPKEASATKSVSPPKRKRQSTTASRGGGDMADQDAPVDAVNGAPSHDAAKKKKQRSRLFPTGPGAVRRVLAFDVGIVNLAHAVVTLTGDDEFAIESLGANNIMHEDPAGGPPSDDEIIAAAAAAGPRRRRRPGEAAAAPPKPKGRGAKEPLKVLTERLTDYLWARADRLVGRRPHAIVIEQQSKKALRLSALGAVIHSFVLNHYRARGEDPPPVFMQSGRQKLRVVFRPLASSAGADDWRLGGVGSSSGHAPTLMTRFLVTSSSSTSSTSSPSAESSPKTMTVVTQKRPGGGGGMPKAPPKAKTKGKQKKADQGAVWRANKKHAVDNFGPILAHYPGCRRWKPLFDRSKKKDDLADAALHAIFMLKAGGTSLARTKDLDEASLIVLPHRPEPEGESKQKRAVSKTRAPRRRSAPLNEPQPSLDAKDEHDSQGDGIIDLVHYATEGASDAMRNSAKVSGLTCGDLCDDGGLHRGASGCRDDPAPGEDTICLSDVEPPLKRVCYGRPTLSSTTSSSTTTRTTANRQSILVAQGDDNDHHGALYDDDDDDDGEDEDDDDTGKEESTDGTQDSDDDDDGTEYDTDEQDDDDDDWALDLGIC
ncbi:hypothetical protein pkur_cds_245 [Pandoravirus kuranda]|uniref:Uncharacterized protein n=1 Tax=Pandoravirus kuranda TaxID=3019033 RepID=A0AA95ECT3_9VIRU|nr:hypothetical protein pkur_cds_245 [Pandoravirus kuranda]